MYKYNMLYTIKFTEHILTPESYKTYIPSFTVTIKHHLVYRYVSILAVLKSKNDAYMQA